MSPFDPATFASESSLPPCTECKAHKRTGKVPVLRPRVWLYLDDDYPDADAISSVANADLQKKLDVVIVVGTALKIESAKKLAKDMCTAVRRNGGIAVWINLKAPTQDLDCFNLVIEGNYHQNHAQRRSDSSCLVNWHYNGWIPQAWASCR